MQNINTNAMYLTETMFGIDFEGIFGGFRGAS
jgi:hypothetical protein